jgi:cysteine synthase A
MNTFVGQSGISDFLNPANTYTPIVELDSDLNPFLDKGVRIFIKLMSHTSLLNIKHVSVYSMLQNHALADEQTHIVESSSGNTAFSLSILAKYFGFKKTKFLFSHRVPISKLNLIKLLADEIEINKEPLCPDKHDENSSINKAKRLASTSHYTNLDQYSNPSNPRGHYEITGAQIIEQFEFINLSLHYLFAAVGTTGTISGSSSKLKEKFQNLQTIGVASADDMTRLGARSKNLLEEIEFNWKEFVDDLIEVDTQSAFISSLKLIRKGLLVGPSTGHIYSGLINYINQNNLSGVNIVFVACDTFLPYVDEYIKNLPNEFLAKVINEEFAISYTNTQSKIRGKNYNQFSVKASDFIKFYETISGDSIVLDVRKDSEFNAFRLRNVTKVSIHDLEDDVLNITQSFGNIKKIYIIDCGMSDTAKLACLLLREKGLNAYWVDGGMDYISKNSQLVVYS